MRTSAAVTPFAVANTGFRSISTISGKSETSFETPTIRSASAPRCTGSEPRTPFSISAAAMPSSIDSASSRVAGASRNVMSFITSTSTPPRPNATSLPNDGSVTAPTITSCPPFSICWTCTPSRSAFASYFFALAMIVSKPFFAASTPSTPTSTPPASVLCRICGETIFSTTGNPMPEASFAASSADVATPSFGTGMPYASHTSLPSGAVSDVRPSAFALSRTCRTADLLCAIVTSSRKGSNARGSNARRLRPVPASDDLLGPQRGDVARAVAQFLQHLVGVLAQERRALHLGRAVRHLDRVAHRQVLASRGVVDLDDGSRRPKRRLLGDLLHRQDRTARDVVLVEDVHRLELGLRLRPLLDLAEDLHQVRQPRLGRRVARIGEPFGLADDLADVLPDRRLRDEVDVRVRVGLPALALQDPAGLSAARRVAGARHGVEELAVRVLRVLLHHVRAVESLLVAKLHAAQVEHAVLHRREHLLSAACRLALVERSDDAQRQVQPGAAVADLRARHQRRAVVEAGRRRCAARALRDVFVDLAVLVGAGAEALDRGDDHLRVELLNTFPGEAHAVERARREVLDQDIAVLHQRLDHRFALRALRVDGDRALVVVQHREIETVHVRDVAELPARDVAFARALDLDDVGAEPGEELRARRSRLDVREVEDADAV